MDPLLSAKQSKKVTTQARGRALELEEPRAAKLVHFAKGRAKGLSLLDPTHELVFHRTSKS